MDAALAEVMRKHPLLHGVSRAGRERRIDDTPGGGGGFAVLPGLRELLPGGVLARGSVVETPDFGLLSLALVAGASAAGGWLGLAGVPELGVLAAADLGVDTERVLLIPQLKGNWPQVVSSLLDGCEIVLLKTPEPPRAHIRRKAEALLRNSGGVLVVIGGWPGANLRLKVTQREWSGLNEGHGRLRACRAEVVVSGRGAAAQMKSEWLWLPAEDGGIAPADPPLAAGPPLRVVKAG